MAKLQEIAQYSNQALKGIQEVFNNGLQVDVMKYADAKIFDLVTNSVFNDVYTSTESLGGTQELSPSEEVPVSELHDGYSVNYSSRRYGNSIVVNETMMVQSLDSTVRIDEFLKEQTRLLMQDVKHKMITSLFDILNNGFTTTIDSAPDSAAFFGLHTWATGTTFNNSATAAMSEAAMDSLEEYGGDFVDASGKENPLDFDTIIVKKGSQASRTARRLFAEKIAPTQINDINIYEGSKTIVETPFISTANKLNWYARASKVPTRNSLRLKVVQMPKMHEPITNYDNLAVKSAVTGYWTAQIVNMPYDWYGSTGAA